MLISQNKIDLNVYNNDQQDALFTFSSIPVINLYLFRAGLLLIISWYCSVYTAFGMSCVYGDWLLAGSEWNST
jgi:hypothetical protein